MIADKLRAAILVSLLNNESWNRVKLYESATLLSGRDLTKSEYFDEPSKGSIPYITGASNFTPHYGLLINRHTNKPKVIAEPGDVLITCKGTIGAISFPEERVHIARQVMAVRPKNLIPDFLALILEAAVEELKSQAKSMIPGISRDVLLSLEIPVPSIDEQRKVSEAANEIFKALDRLAELEKEREDLDRKFLAQISETVVSSILCDRTLSTPDFAPVEELHTAPASSKRMLKLQSLKVNENSEWNKSPWPVVSLASLCTHMASGSTPKGGRAVYVDSGIPFLRSQNIHNDGLHLEEVAYISPEIHEKKLNSTVYPGDLLLNITGASIGRCSIVKDEFTEANISQHVLILRLADHSLVDFVHEVLTSKLTFREIMALQNGSTKEGLSGEKAATLGIPMPNQSIRATMMTHLTLAHRSIESLRSTLN